MLVKTKDKASGKVLVTSRPLLIDSVHGYLPPAVGKDWFDTTTTIWHVDEMIRRRVRDWRRLTGETGHTGERTGTMREDHDSVYTGTHSVFPIPLMEWMLLRYGGGRGGKVLDAFAGGPPRAVCSAFMGYEYVGVELRKEQITENVATIKRLKLPGVDYILGDARSMVDLVDRPGDGFDFGATCPPYFNLEVYSDRDDDLSNYQYYDEFDRAMNDVARGYARLMKPGAFVCMVVGNFRDKKTGELTDFRSDTVKNFRRNGFKFWQEIILSKNFGSAAKRSTNAWKGLKLVPRHEFLLVFRWPERNTGHTTARKRERVRL